MPKPFVFTEAAIRALKRPASGRVYYRDSKQQGLQLCHTSTGSAIYFYVRRLDGMPTRVRLGTTDELSVKTARDVAAEHAARAAAGENPQADKRARREVPTLAMLWTHWEIHAKKRKKPISAKYDKLNYDKHLAGWSSRKLNTITRNDVLTLHAKIGDSSGTYAANRVLALLRAMLNKASEVGFDGPNAAAKVEKFPEQSRDRFLQPHELKAFFDALHAEKPVFRDFFLVCLWTGARKSNVLAMRWDQLDLAQGLWRIPETKAGVPVTVPLAGAAVDLLCERLKAANGCEWVFPGRLPSGPMKEPRAAWARICTAAGLTDLHIHDLRRSLGSWMAGQNVSLPIIGRALGHSTPQATMVYARLSVDPIRNAIESATTAMLAAGGQVKLLEGKDNG